MGEMRGPGETRALSTLDGGQTGWRGKFVPGNRIFVRTVYQFYRFPVTSRSRKTADGTGRAMNLGRIFTWLSLSTGANVRPEEIGLDASMFAQGETHNARVR